MDRPPHWVRALLALDRVVTRVAHLELAVRDELLWAWVPPDRRGRLTEAIYARQPTYAPGGALFQRGLQPWEERLLERPEIPTSGRVLLGGAGGGRELRALCERGHPVTAFEPSEALARAAQAVAAPFAGSHVLRGRYQDLDDALAGRGPLAPLGAGAPYALVLLGWRSLSHLVEPSERAALFAALARLAPGAPVLASFAPARAGASLGRARQLLRRGFAALGAPAIPSGAMFLPTAGFAVELTREDLEDAARAGNYAIAIYDTEPDGLVLLTSRSPTPRADSRP